MRNGSVSRVGMVMLVGVVVLSVGGALMADNVGAHKPDKAGGSATDLTGATQNWDKVLPADQRFTVLAAFNNEAVRDNETGLVWEKAPSMALQTWVLARINCAQKNVGGRKGWRLPSIEQLASLGDPTVTAPSQPLSQGHPFINIQPSHYWSATTNAGDPTNAWIVGFLTGEYAPPGNLDVGAYDKNTSHYFWCVRGDGPLSEY